jgi:hypothetical protein
MDVIKTQTVLLSDLKLKAQILVQVTTLFR